MAITFPRELPFYRFKECTFATVEGTALNRTANGRAISAVEQYDPWIQASFKTTPLFPAERKVWSAWKSSLRGGMKSFLAYDASRPEPIAYPKGVPEIIATTWDGTGIVTALSARAATVSGLPAGYQASAGDHVGFVLSGRYSVHTLTESDVANGSGIISVDFDPYIVQTLFTIGATAVFWRPKARFVLDPESWEESADIDFSPIGFVGLQVF